MRFDIALACKVGYRGIENDVHVAMLEEGMEHVLVLRTSSVAIVVGTREDLIVEDGSTIRGSFVLVGHLFRRTFEPLDVQAYY